MTQPLRTKQPTEARQTGLVQAALQLAAVHCPAEITTGDLAAEVGITQGAVFKHFDSKEAIWLAALDWVRESLMARLQAGAVAHAARGALEALRAVFVAHVDFVREHPGVPRLVFQELQQGRSTLLKDRVEGLMDAYRKLVGGLLEQARAERSIAADVDTHAATVLFIGAIQGLVMQPLRAGSPDAMNRQAMAVYDIYARGLQGWQ